MQASQEDWVQSSHDCLFASWHPIPSSQKGSIQKGNNLLRRGAGVFVTLSVNILKYSSCLYIYISTQCAHLD